MPSAGPLLLSWALVMLHIFAALGLLRLRAWARTVTIGLAVFGIFLFPPSVIFSIFVLAYLLRRDVARLFHLGERPATLSGEEALRIERTMGRAARA